MPAVHCRRANAGSVAGGSVVSGIVAGGSVARGSVVSGIMASGSGENRPPLPSLARHRLATDQGWQGSLERSLRRFDDGKVIVLKADLKGGRRPAPRA